MRGVQTLTGYQAFGARQILSVFEEKVEESRVDSHLDIYHDYLRRNERFQSHTWANSNVSFAIIVVNDKSIGSVSKTNGAAKRTLRRIGACGERERGGEEWKKEKEDERHSRLRNDEIKYKKNTSRVTRENTEMKEK